MTKIKPVPRSVTAFALPAGVLGSLVLAATLAPIGIAAVSGINPGNPWREFSTALAMSGTALLLIQFLLSGRFFVIAGRAGTDLILRMHQLAARTILLFLLVHPLLYIMPRLLSGRGGAGQFLLALFASDRLRTGVIAWLLLILLTGVSIWRDRLPIRYETWRLTHGLGAGMIAALGLHHTLTVGSYSATPVLTIYWVLLSAIAFASLMIVYFWRPLAKIRNPYRVISVDAAASRMWRVLIEPKNGTGWSFAPGQFVWLNIGHSPFSLTEHPFSISSAPGSLPCIEFTIKESGDFTNHIGKTRTGVTAYIDGPHGNFRLPDDPAIPVVFIVGGVGIAPALSMLRALNKRVNQNPVTLIYGNRVSEQIVAREELQAMRVNLGLQLHLVLGEPPASWDGPIGELTAPVLTKCLGTCETDARYYVCGPIAMMDSVENTLRRLGAKPHQIVTERFRYD